MLNVIDKSSKLRKQIEGLEKHNHLCLIYNSRTEQFNTVIHFMKTGLKRGEKCIYIVDENTASAVLAAMKINGVDVDSVMRSSALTVINKHDAYLKGGYFDPDVMIEFIDKTIDEAKREGYSTVRVTGEMSWALGNDKGVERLIEYEAKLNYFFPKKDILAICQYNRNRFSPDIIRDVLHTHPVVIYDNLICKNHYYIPPEEFLKKENPSNNIDYLLKNIVERAVAEEALVSSEKRLHHITLALGEGLYVLDRFGRLTFMNPEAERLIGWKERELLNKKIHDIIQCRHGDKAEGERWNCPCEEVFKTGGSVRSDRAYFTRKNGTLLPISYVATPLFENGAHSASVVAFQDITKQRRTGERLSKLNNVFLQLRTDYEKNIELLTKTCGELLEATCALYNRLRNGLLCSIGRWNTPDNFRAEDNPDGHICYDVIKEGRGEIFLVRDLPDTAYFHSDPNVSLYGLKTYMGHPVRCHEEFVGSLCVVYNTDYEPDEEERRLIGILASAIGNEEERKRAGDTLRQANRELKASQRASINIMEDFYKQQIELNKAKDDLESLNKDLEERVRQETEMMKLKDKLLIQQSKMASMGEMIGVIAHQWKQPLNAISIIAQDLQDAFEYGELDESYLTKSIGNTMDQIKFMSQTVDDFRNFFLPGKEKVLFKINSAIRETISLILHQLQKKGISVYLTCTYEGAVKKTSDHVVDKVCSCEPELTYRGYSNEFKQVVLNIMDNGKDAILKKREKGAGDEEGVISIELTKEGDEIVVNIEDNGGGIPDDQLEKIFDPYFTTKEDKGTGIGLYMSKTIIEEKLGGAISVVNKGRGAMFSIRLIGE